MFLIVERDHTTRRREIARNGLGDRSEEGLFDIVSSCIGSVSTSNRMTTMMIVMSSDRIVMVAVEQNHIQLNT